MGGNECWGTPSPSVLHGEDRHGHDTTVGGALTRTHTLTLHDIHDHHHLVFEPCRANMAIYRGPIPHHTPVPFHCFFTSTIYAPYAPAALFNSGRNSHNWSYLRNLKVSKLCMITLINFDEHGVVWWLISDFFGHDVWSLILELMYKIKIIRWEILIP